MSYYTTCPNCGANLDPGEHCECTIDNWEDARAELISILAELPQGQFYLAIEEIGVLFNDRKTA